MTCADRIEYAIKNADMTKTSFDKLIALAYWMGRESSAKDIIDKHNNITIGQTDRAAASCYKWFTRKIIGTPFIYSSDYNQDMTKEFGSDKWGVDDE